MSLVYFIQEKNNGPIKIGFTSKSANNRLSALQTGSSADLEIVYTIEAEASYERYIHRVLKRERIRGEWFKPWSVLTLIKYLKAEGLSGIYSYEALINKQRTDILHFMNEMFPTADLSDMFPID